jgi:hypothetical protein
MPSDHNNPSGANQMANDKANDMPANPNAAAPNLDGGELHAQAFRDTTGTSQRNQRAGAFDVIKSVWDMHQSYGKLQEYIQEGKKTTAEVEKGLAELDGNKHPRAGVRVTIYQDADGNFMHMTATKGRTAQEAFDKHELNPAGTKRAEIWIPDNPNLNQTQALRDGTRYEEMSLQKFQQIYGFKNYRAEAESPNKDAPALAGNQDTKQLLASLNITAEDRGYFKLQGEKQFETSQTAKTNEPKPLLTTTDAPAQDAPSRMRTA